MDSKKKNLTLAAASIGIGLFLLTMSARATTVASTSDRRQITDWGKERVLVIGDSLGVGLGLVIEGRLKDRGVGAYSNISLVGSSINQWGKTGHKLNTALLNELQSFKPTLVLISLGTNDEATRKYSLDPPAGPEYNVGKSRKKYIEALQNILKDTYSVWLGPPQSDPSLWPMDRNFRNMLKGYWGDRYFDTEAINPAKRSDRVHFSPSGNRFWTDSILNFLEKAV
jgi:lysophospholipase L1-like esterase